jgi:hypothetical protein
VWLKAEQGLLKHTLLMGRIALNWTGIFGMLRKEAMPCRSFTIWNTKLCSWRFAGPILGSA